MRTRRTLFLLLVLLVLPGALRADPPGRVARLGYFTGSVSFRPASLDDWAPASPNYPFSTGDHLWTDDDARGEFQVGSSVVRLAPRTAFSFLNVDDDALQMRISEGAVAVTVGDLYRDEIVEVDTPDAAVSLLESGFYLVEVSEDGSETMVTVRHGEAEVTAGGAAVLVHSGDALVVRGGDSPRYDVREADAPNEWEDWCLQRDRRGERGESRRYVSAAVIGYQDLDDHGSWRDDPEYGHVWAPRHVEVDWAPYRYGHWAFVHPWGWTWIDDASWGFAPFHYGRWARRDWGWFWVPGSFVSRPVYAPALVAFVGGENFSLSISVGGGGVGWFPLGPREIYVPPYDASPNYIRNVNVTNVTNITNINVTNINVNTMRYANRNVAGAVTVVNHETFVGSRPVGRNAIRVSTLDAGRASVRPGVVTALKPRRESILGTTVTSGAVRKPSAQAQQRAVVTRVTPPAPRARLAEEGRPAPARRSLVKPASVEGRGVSLRPTREGLPAARAVRPGERPTTTKPAARQGPDERPRVTRPPVNERPTTTKPADRPTPDERPRVTRPPVVERPTTTKPADRPTPDERPRVTRPPVNERDNGRPADRGNERPPVNTKPKPPAQQGADERPPVTRPPADERERGRPADRGNERPGVSKPSPPDRGKEPPTTEVGDKPRGQATPKPGREGDKAKGKPSKSSPSPSPSPSPRGNDR